MGKGAGEGVWGHRSWARGVGALGLFGVEGEGEARASVLFVEDDLLVTLLPPLLLLLQPLPLLQDFPLIFHQLQLLLRLKGKTASSHSGYTTVTCETVTILGTLTCHCTIVLLLATPEPETLTNHYSSVSHPGLC